MKKTFVLFFLFCSVALFGDNITYKTLKGNDITPYASDINTICAKVYREYPYLYEAEMDDYTYYLGLYGKSANSIIVFAFDGTKVIGMATGIPLTEYRSHYVQPFAQNKYDINKIFYVGELVLFKEYRGQGIGKQLYMTLEDSAKHTNKYNLIAFSQIDESFVKQPQPDDYKQIDGFWTKLGFVKHPELSYDASWKVIGDIDYSKHPMYFWTKQL
jgi:GNAT superfamily N-acetyltransferase